MGYRHTLISEDPYIEWPDWFVEKYQYGYLLSTGLIASRVEGEYYDNKLFYDIQRAIKEFDPDLFPFHLVATSEDGVVNKVSIYADKIVFKIATDWVESNGLDQYGA